MIKIAPSILSSNFTTLGETIKHLEHSGADMIHIDVMDGSFVNQITFGHKMVKDIRSITNLPLDVHLMIVNPEKHIDSFADAGADIITVHQESAENLTEIIKYIKSTETKASVSIKPDTPVDTIFDVLPLLDMVLIMTVVPGLGGQALIESTLDKVNALYKMKETNSMYTYDIQVDGGINPITAGKAIFAGANILVAGSAITKTKDYKTNIDALRGNS